MSSEFSGEGFSIGDMDISWLSPTRILDKWVIRTIGSPPLAIAYMEVAFLLDV